MAVHYWSVVYLSSYNGMEYDCNVNKKGWKNVTQLSDTGLMLGYPKGGLWVKAVRREV